MNKVCRLGGCEDDPIYPNTPVIPALPSTDGGGGHEFITTLPESGTPGVEYIVMGDPRDCSSFKGSYVWNPEGKCWVVTSGAGGGALDSYTFEKTTTGWVAKKNGKVIFTYNDERIIQNQTDIANIKNDIYGNYLTDRISVCDGGPLKMTVDATDPKKKKIKLCLDGDLGDRSDGAYEIKGQLSTYLSTALLGTTPVNVANVPDLNPADIVLGETYLYDHQGTMGVVKAYDPTTGVMTVVTMTTSPGERQGVRLGAVEEQPDLPTTITAATALGWLTPVPGDFAYVRKDGPDKDKIGEWVVQGVDGAGNITWAFSHYINAGNYVVDINLSDGTLIPKNPDGTVTLPNYVRTVELADGTTLTVDKNGKVTLPDFGTLKGVRTSDGTLLTVATDGTVTLPVIPKRFNTYLIKTSLKDWLDAEIDIDSLQDIDPAKMVDIVKEGASMTVADFVAEVQPKRDIIYIHGDDNGSPTQEAITWFDSYNVTTGIRVMILAIPRAGSGGATDVDTEVPEYTRDLHAGDEIKALNLITYNNVLYRALTDVTLTGNWNTDKTHFEVINSEAKNVYYNINRGGQETRSCYAKLVPNKTLQMYASTTRYPDEGVWDAAVANGRIPFRNEPQTTPTFDQPSDGAWTIPPHTRVELSLEMSFFIQTGKRNNLAVSVIREDTGERIANAHMYDDNAANGAGYNLNNGIVCQFENDTDKSITVSVKVMSGDGTATRFGSQVTLQEVGRIVDPIAYLNNDGNSEATPVGNIISYLGNDVPKHYLACDGAEYAIGTYPQLEAHFLKEFGSITHFGVGSAAGTYKVPDLQGEFLRGAGTNSHSQTIAGVNVPQGNGANVGDHQNATTFGNTYGAGVKYEMPASVNDWSNANKDSFSSVRPSGMYINTSSSGGGTNDVTTYTARPTNTAVKYCIQYETVPKIVIDQGTFKVSCPVSFKAQNTEYALDLDEANATEDTSMVDSANHSFVIPETGYYAISFDVPTRMMVTAGNAIPADAAYIYKMKRDGQEFISDRGAMFNSANNNGYWSKAITVVRKCTIGDVLEPVISFEDLDNSTTAAIEGIITISMVNCSDRDISQIMLKPNLWTPGVEQSFGDKVYGMRWTGTYRKTKNGREDFILSVAETSNITLIQVGGDQKRIGFSFCPSTYLDSSQNNCLIFYPKTREWRFITTDGSGQSNKYDVWAIYTKN